MLRHFSSPSSWWWKRTEVVCKKGKEIIPPLSAKSRANVSLSDDEEETRYRFLSFMLCFAYVLHVDCTKFLHAGLPKGYSGQDDSQERKGNERRWAEVGNLLSFCSAYEFPAMYVYGFRDRLASREIGLSTYSNSSPASPFRQTRTRVQHRSFNYAFYRIRGISRERAKFCGENRCDYFIRSWNNILRVLFYV